MQEPNYTYAGMGIDIDSLLRLKRLKEQQEKSKNGEALPDGTFMTGAGSMFSIDPPNPSAFDIDEAMGFRSKKVRK